MRVSARSAGVPDQAELSDKSDEYDEPHEHDKQVHASPEPAPQARSALAPLDLETRPGHSGERGAGGALISHRKAAFLAQAVQVIHPLPVEAYRQIAIDYKAKHGIDIRFNGGDDNPVLHREQRDWLEKRRATLTGDQAYVGVAEAVFDTLSQADLLDYFADMRGLVFVSQGGRVDMDHVESFIARIKGSPRWKPIYEQEVIRSIIKLSDEARTLGLSRRGAVETIMNLMSQASNGPIGFLRSSRTTDNTGILQGYGDICGFIVTRDRVIGTRAHHIEPVVAALDGHPWRYAEPDFAALMLGPQTGPQTGPQKGPMQQADRAYRGSLTVSILKELLKDDARLLLNDCLIFSNMERAADPEGYPLDNFLPAPQVLRYGQSDLYIKVVRAVVAGKESEGEVQHEGRTYRVQTLAGLQRAGASFSRVDGRAVDLDDFKARWLKTLDEVAIPARASMQWGTGDNAHNRYVPYLVHRHNRRFNAA